MAVSYMALAADLARETISDHPPTVATLYVVRRIVGGRAWYWREPSNTWTADLKKATVFRPALEAVIAMQTRCRLDPSVWAVVPIDCWESK